MPSGREEKRATGTDSHGKPCLSGQARAQHYRHYATEIRALAEARAAGGIRDRLTVIARQYEALAGIRHGQSESAKGAPANGRTGKRKRTATAALP